METHQRKHSMHEWLYVFMLAGVILISTPHHVMAQFTVTDNLRPMEIPVAPVSLKMMDDPYSQYAPKSISAIPSLVYLVGKWNVNTLASGPGEPYWFRGRIAVIPRRFMVRNRAGLR